MYRKLTEVYKTIEENKKNIEVLPTGLGMLDADLDGGFLKKELVVLGGKTGGGKSLFGSTIFYNVAKTGQKCAYFSLEISDEMLVSRLVGAEANLSPTRVMITHLEELDQAKANEAKADISVYEELMHFYDDVYELDKIQKEIRDNKYDFVVIDFIQNIIDTTKKDEYERLSFISLELQRLAKSENCCLLVLSQLSNRIAYDKTKDKEIVEYKGSGSIATVCDLGFFIENGETDKDFCLRLRKNRRGISGQEYYFRLQTPGGRIISK